MKNLWFGVFVSVLAGLPAGAGSDGEKPVKNTAPLSTDEIAIYRAVLRQYESGDSGSLNVSARTYPLDPDSQLNRLADNECLKGIRLENLAELAHSFHDLTPEVLPAKNMKLVDPKQQGKIVSSNDPDKTIGDGKSVDDAVKGAFNTALFSMSEIAFDREHLNAAVSYRFWCGLLCGNGATLVFQKVGDRWKKANRHCGGWVS
jgi:hypothetical protein